MEVERLTTPRKGLFLVRRTSSLVKPCDSAFEVEMLRVDRRCCDDPKKIPAHKGTDGGWYDSGTNHRIENGQICRDMGWYRTWAVKIPDVMAFVDEHGECVVSRNQDGFPEIEIYDDYRE